MTLPDALAYELIDGRLVPRWGQDEGGNALPDPSYRHGAILENLRRALEPFVWQADIGQVLDNVAFAYDPARPNHAPLPDLVFVSDASLAKITDEDTAPPFAPELAIEVVSSTDMFGDVDRKANEYITFGSRLVWVISPFDKSVYVYAANRYALRLGEQDSLDGGDVLPGFTIPVAHIFAQRHGQKAQP